MSLALRYLAHSEIGLVRKNNQDSAYTSPTMLMVADGMGGAAAGDLASAVAIKELREADGRFAGDEMLGVLATAIDRASAQISDLIRTDPSLDGMGSTVCGAMFDGEQLALANIGDSRAYRFRDGELARLTRDHSWVQTLVDEGRITEAEALVHPHRSLILKVINGQPQHQPDLELADARLGDRLLFCSDGLCGLVTDEVIAQHLAGDPATVMDALVALAYAEGGLDNITIILADVVEGEPSGVTQVYGAAALLDIDGPMETTLRHAVVAADGTPPRPDPTAGEDARYAPTNRRRSPRVWVKVVLAVLLPVLAIGGGLGLWYGYTQQKFFVGPNDATVAVFQGIHETVLTLPLSHVVQADTTRLDDLPPYYKELVLKTWEVPSLEQGQVVLAELRKKAEECIAQRAARAQATATPSPTNPATTPAATPGVTPSKTASPSSTSKATKPAASPSPSGTPSTTPTVSPTPTASPTPTGTDTPPAMMEC